MFIEDDMGKFCGFWEVLGIDEKKSIFLFLGCGADTP